MSTSVSIPPDIVAFVSASTPTLKNLTISAVWLGVSIPLLIVLFFFSTEKLRRKPIFILNAISISVGIIMGLLNVVLLVKFLLTVQITTTKVLLAIFVPIALLKSGRLANLVLWVHRYSILIRTANYTELAVLSEGLPEATVEWTLQVVDNATSSSLFLWRLYKNARLPAGLSRNNGKSSSHWDDGSQTLHGSSQVSMRFATNSDIDTTRQDTVTSGNTMRLGVVPDEIILHSFKSSDDTDIEDNKQ
ncbi:hypothetical protein POSPLADRAFT_1154990 [Postia placenta MAD-698-R-SB12]|uniref:Uncharacterized protein n=1 Tax=Postia placenta MAD-698-R-SB12 TaxID=670580 RepID=A0A1X6MPH4_9APHY|nr:hypothetical protein POSPLADRAFT_1154990 [Postia placenta MAD-698-R-SB12]OSX58092.1 hypothetical protein POSPLADRAFT_1154990 [Postia placenta MAD-698-R-SB12]